MACAVVSFGRTQSGKSTTLGKLRKPGQALPTIGDGDGESVTDHSSIIDTELGLMLDTPGMDDSQLRFTDDEAGRRVALGVVASGVDKVKFLVFESLANDAMQLRGTLEKLSRAFGARALRASVVLATKADMRDAAQRDRRLALIRRVVQETGLQDVVLWQNQELDEAGNAAQLASLRDSLGRFEGIATVDLEDLRSRQLVRAQQKCDAYPTQTKNTEVEVEEQYTVPREVQETYQEPYVEQEQYMEDYDAPETYEVPEQRRYTYKKKKGGLAGLFGGKKTCTGFSEVKVQKVKMVKKQRAATRDVTRLRTAQRTVTHYDEKTRKKLVPQVAEFRFPIDRFMDEALAEIIEEVRQSFVKR